MNQSSIQRIFLLWEENEKEYIFRIALVTRIQLNKLHHVSLQCYTSFLNDYGIAIDRSPLNFLWYLPCAATKSEQLSILLFIKNARCLSTTSTSRSLQRLRIVPCDSNISTLYHSLFWLGCSSLSLHFSIHMKLWGLQ